MPYNYKHFPYSAPPGLQGPEPRKRVVIVGAGPIGLALALDLAGHGLASTVLDDNDVVSVGSRAICWSKRSLEILDRLGIGDRCVEKGVTWKVGRTFHRAKEVFRFDLLPEDGHKMPAFVNLQQYYVEEFLAEAALDNPLIDVRFKNRVRGVEEFHGHVYVDIQTPDGEYSLETEWLVACDGANSPIRRTMGLDFEGELFEDRFLIADIELKGEYPSERLFWFEPDFHSGQSALFHKQPDGIFRIDLQLGWDADPDEERKPDRVIPRIEKVVGHADFRLDWVSVYTFQCRRLERFVHGRRIFCGDSAHVVSPFGARGGNGGLQDVDALGWRLARLAKGGSTALLEAYDRERCFAADENIRHSSRATRFMTPADGYERLFRDQALHLAGHLPFAQAWVNSGRLSTPCIYPSAGEDTNGLPQRACPGAVAPDAPQGKGWLLSELGGDSVLLSLGAVGPTIEGLRPVAAEVNDTLRQRYLGTAVEAHYLIRPDQVIAARWTDPDPVQIAAARDALWEVS